MRLLLTLGGFLVLVRLLLEGDVLARRRRLQELERAAREQVALATWRAEAARAALLSAVKVIRMARRLTATR